MKVEVLKSAGNLSERKHAVLRPQHQTLIHVGSGTYHFSTRGTTPTGGRGSK